ncbi:maleamate amidohydrolase [Actinocorallia herbida]|uniref:Maleamate amidohydrolase n=1 Tax=Actinocorallia herbida TaxID=58109 RepID=A0A3N1D5Y2_9ACTN|nr:isochorismatase family protein [Actinocorallia herbida]ROO88498.1 maleamate amidohydrolase [Actinocorallia herbida]
MDLEQDYEAAGFGGSLPFGKRPAVLVVDMVRAYLVPESPLYAGVEKAVEAAAELVAAGRAADVPVVFTKVEYLPGGTDGGLFFRKVPALAAFVKGGEYGAFVPELVPAEGDVVVTKQYASAFFGTSLAATLTALGVDSLLICGLSTSGCVRATGVDALQHGFVPYVVADACGDRDPRPHEAALFDLKHKYAEVVSIGEAVELLQGLPTA